MHEVEFIKSLKTSQERGHSNVLVAVNWRFEKKEKSQSFKGQSESNF